MNIEADAQLEKELLKLSETVGIDDDDHERSEEDEQEETSLREIDGNNNLKRNFRKFLRVLRIYSA